MKAYYLDVTAPREGSAVLFVNPKGEVLLRLREDKPGLMFAGRWDTIGGGVEPGESHEATAIRETMEETGLALRGQIYWRDYQSVVLLHIYVALLDVAAEDIALTEGERLGWFDLATALALPLHPWVEDVLPQFFDSDVFRRTAALPAEGT